MSPLLPLVTVAVLSLCLRRILAARGRSARSRVASDATAPNDVTPPVEALPERDDLDPAQADYRRSYVALFPGCRGHCVAGSGGTEPYVGRCPTCGYGRDA